MLPIKPLLDGESDKSMYWFAVLRSGNTYFRQIRRSVQDWWHIEDMLFIANQWNIFLYTIWSGLLLIRLVYIHPAHLRRSLSTQRWTRANANETSTSQDSLAFRWSVNHTCTLALRDGWFDKRKMEPSFWDTYQSHSSEASHHLDLTLSRILTCGTWLWRWRKTRQRQADEKTGMIKEILIWDAIKKARYGQRSEHQLYRKMLYFWQRRRRNSSAGLF